MIYTKKYWSTGEYSTQTGEKYAGYVGIKDGKAYIFDTEEELIASDGYITNINISDSFLDRVLAKELKLPYSKSDIQFGANDFLYSSTVIDIVEKLQANNDYIFRNNIISDTLLPSTEHCTIFSSADVPLYLYQYRDSEHKLVKLPKDTVANNGYATLEDGTSVKIAMMPNYSYSGSGNIYQSNVTANQAYADCYTNGELNTTYSSVPYLAFERELQYPNGGILKRYNFKDRGFSGVTKSDPFFYSTIENEPEFYVNKDKDLEIKSYKVKNADGTTRDVAVKDVENLKYYRNPLFVYTSLKPSVNHLDTITNIVNSYKNNKNYTLIPDIVRCDKKRYTYVTTSGATKTGNIGDTYLNIKNKTGFKSLKYVRAGQPTYMPFDYMTADEAYKDAQLYSDSIISPVFDNAANYWEIKDINGVVHYGAGSSTLKSILGTDELEINFINNPLYYSKKYEASANTTLSSLCESLKTDTDLKYYEYVPVIDAFEHSMIKSPAKFDFDKIKNSDICITDVSYNNVKKKYVTALAFLITENQLAIIKFKQYITNTSYNSEDYEADFNNPETENIIIIDKVDPSDKTSLNFKNLAAVKVYKDNLYLVDEDLNMVLHYDISYLLKSGVGSSSLEPFKKYSITLLNLLQGDGTKNDKVYFNKPHHINADDNHVYVVDRGNKSVKVFSHTLNYVKSLQNGYFAQHDIQAVACNPYSFKLENGVLLPKNSVWIFSSQSNRFFLSIIVDDNVVYYGQIESLKVEDDAYSWKEEIRSINFSTTNSNYYYFSTSKRVYKFHCTSPLWPFASLSYYKQHSLNSALVWEQLNYQWNNIPSLYAGISDESVETKLTWGYEKPVTSAEILNNKCFSLCGYDYNEPIPNTNGLYKQFQGDLVFHFGVLYDNIAIANFIKANSTKYRGDLSFDNIPSGDKIKMTKSVALFTYIEPDSYINAISDVAFKSYPKYEITDNIGNEYINPLTFNKLIYQVIYNLMEIKEQIFGKFKGAANADGVVVYESIIMDSYIDELKLLNSPNYFVHNNEVLSITINRIFEDLLTLQENIIKIMQTVFMSSQSFVNSATKII